MPGVPPNALAQMKKGLKGLFSRKQKKNAKDSTPQAPAAVAPSTTETKNGGSASMAPNEPMSSATPHIAEPGNVSSSQAIDLNPAAPPPKMEEGKLEPKTATDEMSATSGPVSTDLYGAEGTSAAPAMASKAKDKAKDGDDSSEEAIEDMEEGHAGVADTPAVETKPEAEANMTT